MQKKSIQADGASENKKEKLLYVYILGITKMRSAVCVHRICLNGAEGTDIIKLCPGDRATP